MDSATTGVHANPLANALSRWDSEGGAQGQSLTAAESDSIIRHLGAAVLVQWSSLPRESQRALFDAAVDMDEPGIDADTFKQQMAVFLHHSKSREADAVDEGGEGGGVGAGA